MSNYQSNPFGPRQVDRQPYGLTLQSAAATEPVTSAQFKAQARVDIPDDDTLITLILQAAREWCETFTGRRFVTQTWNLTLDYFPSSYTPIFWPWGNVYAGTYSTILLPYPPLVSISSITYNDENGDSQTLATSAYTVDTKQIVGRVMPSYSNAWPATYPDANAVTIQFVCGFGAASAVPASIRQAILILAADMYQNRETDAEKEWSAPSERSCTVAEKLLWSNRVVEFA